MGKAKHKISFWKQYNQALVNRGFIFSDSAIETSLMMKGIFKLQLRGLYGFLNSVFTLMNVPLKYLTYTCISKRSKTIKVKYCLPSRGAVVHVIIDATNRKIYGEGEWKTRKQGKEKRRIWRKRYLAVHVFTHERIAAEVSLVSMG